MRGKLRYIFLFILVIFSNETKAQSISKAEAKTIVNKILDKMGKSAYKATVSSKTQYKKKTPILDNYSIEVVPNGRCLKSKSQLEIAEGNKVLSVSHTDKEISYVDWEMDAKEDPYFNQMQELLAPNNPDEFLRSYFEEMVKSYTVIQKKEGGVSTLTISTKDPQKRISYLKIVYKESLELVNYEIRYKNVFSTDYKGNPVFSNVVTKVNDIDYSLRQLSDKLSNYVSVNGKKVVMKKYKNYKLYIN